MSDSSLRTGSSALRRPIYDPELVPHDPEFADLSRRGPAVARERLHPDALRARLAAPPAWQPEMRGDARLATASEPLRPAAVLVPLVARDGDVSVLLTQRTAHLYDHAGQIAFPGGRAEDDDAHAAATALREAHEEIGLDPAAVDVIGHLPTYVTITGYQVTPIVGLIEQEFDLHLDTFEVEEAFEVPLAFLMNPANHERRRVELEGRSRTFYAMPYVPPARPDARARRYFIWGATAAMLRNFYHLLAA